jgi:hypothetical protein
VRIEQFHHAREGLLNTGAVSSGDVTHQLKVIAVVVGVVVVAQVAQDLGQVIDDEAIAGREHLAADNVHLPAGQVKVQAVEEGGVVVLGGSSVEEVAMRSM